MPDFSIITPISIDIIGLILIWMVKLDFGLLRRKIKGVDDKLFNVLLLINRWLLYCDIIAWIINGKPGAVSRIISIVFNTGYYILHPLMAVVWIMYSVYQVNKYLVSLKSLFGFILILPVVVITILSVVSWRIPIFFGLDEHNNYFRGDYFILFVISNALYFIIAIVKVSYEMKTSKSILRNDKKLLLLYPLMPVAGAVLQSTFYYSVNFTWILTAMSLQVIYFNFQNVLIMTDELTGLNNRRRFEMYLSSNADLARREGLFYVIMIDVNHFKQINDCLGHMAGDGALKDVAQVIVHSVRRKDFVARLGGDEFVVAGIVENEDMIKEIVAFIRESTEVFNLETQRDYLLSLGMGYGTHDLSTGKPEYNSILHEADLMMYEDKSRAKKDKVLRALREEDCK